MGWEDNSKANKDMVDVAKNPVDIDTKDCRLGVRVTYRFKRKLLEYCKRHDKTISEVIIEALKDIVIEDEIKTKGV